MWYEPSTKGIKESRAVASQEQEPCLRMAISSIRNATEYVKRLPGRAASIDAAVHDMERAIAHIEKYADKKGVVLRERMKT